MRHIYFFILILFIFCIIIILKKHNKPQEKFANINDVKPFMDVSKIKESSIKPLIFINKIDVVDEDPDQPNKYLLIEGNNLDKVEKVYFGDLQGIEIGNEIIEENSTEGNIVRLKIVPPNLAKFKRTISNFKDLEIKLQIEDSGEVKLKDLQFGSDDKLEFIRNKGDKEFVGIDEIEDRENTQSGKISIPDLDISGINEDIPKKMKIILTLKGDSTDFFDTQNIKIKLGESDFKEFTLKLNKEKIIEGQDFEIFIDVKNINNIRYNIDTQELFKNNENFNNLEITGKIDYLFDDINMLLPTGLFYRNDFVSAGNEGLARIRDVNSEDWNIYISNQLENPDVFLAEDVKQFYKDVKKITAPPPDTSISQAVRNLQAQNLNVEEIEGDSTVLRLTWEIPEGLEMPFGFLVSIKPKSDSDNFRVINEKIFSDKNYYEFSTNEMIPGNFYIYQVFTTNFQTNQIKARADEIELRYEPPNFDEYHSHIFNSEKGIFDTNKPDQERKNMLKTYLQLLELNRRNMAVEMVKTQKNINNNSQCLERNLVELETNKNKVQDAKFNNLLEQDVDNKSKLYNEKQDKQDKRIEDLKKQVKALEEIHGKVKKNQDLSIKRLSSENDNTELAVKRLKNGKYMVGINQGCLAANRGGKYDFIPCNMFDTKQYFNIDTINNEDEYNNLLSMNLKPKLNSSNKVEYPFYVLKPNLNNKCVHTNNSSLSIKSCDDNASIRYIGHFSNKECQKN